MADRTHVAHSPQAPNLTPTAPTPKQFFNRRGVDNSMAVTWRAMIRAQTQIAVTASHDEGR